MNKESKEHLSSLMDGELSQETGLFVARRMGTDRELSATWARYHLIRDCLRQPGSKWVASDISLDIGDVGITSAGPSPTVSRPQVPAWLRLAGGAGLAAAVAVVALVVAVPAPQAPDADSVAADSQPFVSPNVVTSGAISRPVSLAGQDRTDQQRLNSYLLRHNQAAGAVSPQGFITFMPIVTSPRPTAAQVETTAVDEAAPDNRNRDRVDTN